MGASGLGAATRPIILCADDYGLNAGVNSAILDLAHRRRISAASCMTNMPGWPDAAAQLRPLSGRIGIGLHLTLTEGAPLGPMPRLAPGGELPRLGMLLRSSFTGAVPRREVVAEFGRQIEAFRHALGRDPDFVDGHQHVHVLPGVRQSVLAALSVLGLSGRVWLRDPSDSRVSVLRRGVAVPKALFVGWLARGFARQAAEAGFATNRGFSGFGPFDPGRAVAADMARYLVGLGPDPLVMCHPGMSRDGGEPADAISGARAREYAYLASADFPALLAVRGLELRPAPKRIDVEPKRPPLRASEDGRGSGL